MDLVFYRLYGHNIQLVVISNDLHLQFILSPNYSIKKCIVMKKDLKLILEIWMVSFFVFAFIFIFIYRRSKEHAHCTHKQCRLF